MLSASALGVPATLSTLIPSLASRSLMMNLPAKTPIEPVRVPGSATMVAAGAATK